MAETDESTERTAVRTYVPAYQKEAWAAEADDLDMSLSEFVRTMVQAGRSDISQMAEEPQTSDADPRGRGLESRVLDILEKQGPQSWQALVDAVTEDIEDELDETLETLQAANRIQHSGREGGYRITGDAE